MQLYYGDLIPYLHPLLLGLLISIAVSAAAVVGGGGLALVLYAGRSSTVRVIRAAAATYIEIIRNTPLLLQLYLIYFALPQAGVNLDRWRPESWRSPSTMPPTWPRSTEPDSNRCPRALPRPAPPWA